MKKYNEFVKKINESVATEAFEMIRHIFTEEKVAEIFDEEFLNWVDADWAEDEGEYESEYEWYIDHNNGEAEEVVIDEMIDAYEAQYGKLDLDDKLELSDLIKNEYTVL